MHFDLDWKNQEERKIRHGNKTGFKKKDLRPWLFLAYSLGLLMVTCMIISPQSVETLKTEKKQDQDELKWMCPSCGYKNLEGIEKCGVCGKRRR